MKLVRGLAAVAVLVAGSAAAFAAPGSNVPAAGAGPTLPPLKPIVEQVPPAQTGAVGTAPVGPTGAAGATGATGPATDATAPTPPASLKCKGKDVPAQVTKRNGKVVWKCVAPDKVGANTAAPAVATVAKPVTVVTTVPVGTATTTGATTTVIQANTTPCTAAMAPSTMSVTNKDIVGTTPGGC